MPVKDAVLIPLVALERGVFPQAQLEIEPRQPSQKIQKVLPGPVLVSPDQSPHGVALLELDAPFQSLRIEVRLFRWIVRNCSDASGVPNPLAFRRDRAFRGIVRAVLDSDRDLVQACTN